MATGWNEGMQVILYPRGRRERPTVTRITRALKSYVEIENGQKFSISKYGGDTLWERGASSGGMWGGYCRIEAATPERLEQIAAEQREREQAEHTAKLKRAMADFILNDVAADELKPVYDLLRNMGMPEVKP